MALHYTPNFQLGYIDVDTPLADLAAASLDMATKTDAALTRGGVAPPDAQSLVALTGRVSTLETKVGPGDAGLWTDYTVAADGGPLWRCSSGAPLVGNGQMLGRHVKRGRMVTVRLFLSMGSTSSGGTGDWTFGLPFTAAAALGEQVLPVKLNCQSGDFTGVGLIAAGTSYISVRAPQSGTNNVMLPVRNSTPTATPGTGIPVFAGDYSFKAGNNMVITGTYESAS